MEEWGNECGRVVYVGEGERYDVLRYKGAKKRIAILLQLEVI